MQTAGMTVAFMLALAAAESGAFAQSCPSHAHVTSTTLEGNVRTVHCGCDDGYENRDGRCQPVAGKAYCISDAGQRLRRDQQQGCADELARCFSDNKTPLSTAALSCVAGCRQPAACAVACEIAGMAAEAYIERCIEVRNSCFEAALSRHRAALAACR